MIHHDPMLDQANTLDPHIAALLTGDIAVDAMLAVHCDSVSQCCSCGEPTPIRRHNGVRMLTFCDRCRADIDIEIDPELEAL